MRIVFADDSDVVRTTIKRLLIEYSLNWEIHEAKTGREALAQAVMLKPDLVLLDINLPDLQGSDVAKEIRKIMPSVRIVLCSLRDACDMSDTVKASGADDYISKLTPIQDFYRELLALMEKPKPPSTHSGTNIE
jgi:DNA-binding NarL/FixJ family response regulator